MSNETNVNVNSNPETIDEEFKALVSQLTDEERSKLMEYIFGLLLNAPQEKGVE